MTGRIIRLVDRDQVGTIAADDGDDYVFHASALTHGTFRELVLGTPVSFEPIMAHGSRRATLVRVLK
jgi:cold shock CspA family protein